jgi:hypothetical protein
MIKKNKKAQVYLATSILMNVNGFLLNLSHSEKFNHFGILIVLMSIIITALALVESYLSNDLDRRHAMNKVFFISGLGIIITVFLIVIFTR